MKVTKSELSFLALMDKIAEKSTPVQLSIVDAANHKAAAYLMHKTNGVVISEFTYEGEEQSFQIVVNYSSFSSLVKSVKDVAVTFTIANGLEVSFNNGKSKHTLEMEDEELPDMNEFLSQIKEKSLHEITISNMGDYATIKSFVAPYGELTKNSACVFMQGNHYVAMDDPMDKSLIAMVKTDSSVESKTSVNRFFPDMATVAKAESIVVKQYENLDYMKMGDNHLFISSYPFLDMPDWFSDRMKERYDHVNFVTFKVEDMNEVLQRFQILAKDPMQQKLVFRFSKDSLSLSDFVVESSKEEIACSLSSDEMEGWEIILSASRLNDTCSVLKKGSVKLHIKENKTNEVVKLQTENEKLTFIVKGMTE